MSGRLSNTLTAPNAPAQRLLRLHDGAILSLSPERLSNRRMAHIQTRLISSIASHGLNDPQADRQQAQKSVTNSMKDRAENLMIVDDAP